MTPLGGIALNVTRNLGFGKIGRPFRWYECSGCKGQISPIDERCPSCGARFIAESPQASKPDVRIAVKGRGRNCDSCGKAIAATDRFCKSCGARVATAPANPPTKKPVTAVKVRESLVLPKRKEPKMTKDWRETGMDLKEFVEK